MNSFGWRTEFDCRREFGFCLSMLIKVVQGRISGFPGRLFVGRRVIYQLGCVFFWYFIPIDLGWFIVYILHGDVLQEKKRESTACFRKECRLLLDSFRNA